MEGPCGQSSQPQGPLNSWIEPIQHVRACVHLCLVWVFCGLLVSFTNTVPPDAVANVTQVMVCLPTTGMFDEDMHEENRHLMGPS